jgi:hypothetical protein
VATNRHKNNETESEKVLRGMLFLSLSFCLVVFVSVCFSLFKSVSLGFVCLCPETGKVGIVMATADREVATV